MSRHVSIPKTVRAPVQPNAAYCPLCKSTGLDFSAASHGIVTCPMCKWQGSEHLVENSFESGACSDPRDTMSEVARFISVKLQALDRLPLPPDLGMEVILIVWQRIKGLPEWPEDGGVPEKPVTNSEAIDILHGWLAWAESRAKADRGNGKTGQGKGKDAGDGTAEASLTWAQKLQKLEPAARKAYLAYEWADSKAGRRLTDEEAYEMLKEEGIPEGVGDAGDLTDYDLPSFETWTKYVRNARAPLGEQKYKPRKGRHRGKSVVRDDEIDSAKARR